MKTTFSIEQVREYVEGWLGSDDDMQSLSIHQVKSMLNNAAVCLEDPSDGIFSYITRTSYYAFLEQGLIQQKSVIP